SSSVKFVAISSRNVRSPYGKHVDGRLDAIEIFTKSKHSYFPSLWDTRDETRARSGHMRFSLKLSNNDRGVNDSRGAGTRLTRESWTQRSGRLTPERCGQVERKDVSMVGGYGVDALYVIRLGQGGFHEVSVGVRESPDGRLLANSNDTLDSQRRCNVMINQMLMKPNNSDIHASRIVKSLLELTRFLPFFKRTIKLQPNGSLEKFYLCDE
ncbi:unnamed protein product, partial [Heterotrigona itama]